MAPNIEQMLPSAKDLTKKRAAARAEEAAKEAARQRELAAKQKELLQHLQAPSGISDEEGVRRAITMIERAIGNGLGEVQVYRFPNDLCTDHGRAINQQEAGWPETLTGVPKEIYQLWDKHFRPRGYRLKAEIVSFPGGMPGDVAMTLVWG